VTSFTTPSRTLKPFAILDRLQGLYEISLFSLQLLLVVSEDFGYMITV